VAAFQAASSSARSLSDSAGAVAIGNQHDEINIFAYATLGSMDATRWQNNERKARFIEADRARHPDMRDGANTAARWKIGVKRQR
jgi:hypothetical protein